MADEDRPHARARRDRERAAAESAAAAGPSAARFLVPGADGEVVAVDAVADLLALDPRTRLRGRGDEQLRTLCGRLDDLVQAGAVVPSGRALLDVLVVDVDERLTLAPTFSLDALFGGGDPRGSGVHDRTVRLALAVLERARAHRAGEVDLHVEVAPVGHGRHPRADEVEATVAVATEGVVAVAGPDPAVVVHDGASGTGWIGVSPAELFVAAARGLLDGGSADVAGAALAVWLTAAQREPDAWWFGLTARVDLDAEALLSDAAARAGSDHPDVVGAALVDRIRGRYPWG